MRRTLTRPAAALLVALLATAACGGDDSSPNPTNTLREQTAALFPTATEDQAGDLADAIVAAADAGNSATADARAFDLAELTLTEFYAGRLAASAADQPADIDQLLTDAFATAGLPDPGIEAANFTTDGLLAVVRAAGGTFTTASTLAGISIPNGAAPRTTLLAVRRLPDSSAYAPKAGPLPTALDQYPLFFDFSFTPDVTLSADGIIGLCQLSDPASAYYPGDLVFGRLQLAHPDPADRSQIELLELVDAPFLVCDDATASARDAALLLRRGGIGGRVRKFSPFAAVDAAEAPGTGQIGQDLEGEGASDQFGTDIALSANGTRVVIGGAFNDGNGANAGHARVFERNGNAWVQLGADLDGEAAEDRFGGAVAISNDGSRIAVGSYLNDGGGSSSGHVRIFDFAGGAWTQVGGDIDGEAGRGSGWAVDLNGTGNRVVIGGPGVGSVNGHVKVYQFIDGVWAQVGTTLAAGAEFGHAVAISDDGNRIAASFPSASGSSQPGSTNVYDWNGAVWTQVGATIRGEGISDNSGGALSLSADGSLLAIGANGNDGGGSSSGHVRVYRLVSGTWTQVGADLDGAAGDSFGSSVTLSADGTRLLAAGTGGGAASVRWYTLAGNTWTLATTPSFGTGGRIGGSAISPDGRTGAYGNVFFAGAAGNASGVVRLYPLP